MNENAHAHSRMLSACPCTDICLHAALFVVDDCRAAYERLRKSGVEFTQEPIDRYGAVDAGFRDPSGDGWKMIEAKPKPQSQRSK